MTDCGINPNYSVKFFRPGVYKVVKFKNGLRLHVPERRGEGESTPNAEKLSQSLTRAKSVVTQIAICNEWQYFFTGTLSPQKVNRYDLSVWKSMSQWLRDQNKKYHTHVKYLILPEKHEDGAWHFHGLLSGVPAQWVSEFVPGIHPQYLIDKGFLNWPAFEKKWGYCSLGEVRSNIGVSLYITKYITKDVARNVTALGAHVYYASIGLKRAVPLGYAYGSVPYFDSVASHDSQYCSTGFVFDGKWSNFIPYLSGGVEALPPLDWEEEVPCITNVEPPDMAALQLSLFELYSEQQGRGSK